LVRSQWQAQAVPQAIVWVAVFEYKGVLFGGWDRAFMRHSNILVQADKNIDNYDVYHVIGTPSVGLTFQHIGNWKDPRKETASLLAMHTVGKIPKSRLEEVKPLMEQVKIEVHRNWNCQDWVRAALERMVHAGMITVSEKDDAFQKQREAINRRYTGLAPNGI
jgi:hypothetical protein